LQQRLVATWAEFQRSVVIMRLISVEKDWKHVLMQKVVTLNTCCDIACLTFQLPHITAGFISEPLTTTPQVAFFRASNI